MANEAQIFALELDREWLAIQGDIREAVQYLASEANRKVKEKSPVDTGQFQNNWLVSVGWIDSSIQVGVTGEHAAKSVAALASYTTKGAGGADWTQGEGYPVIYIQNNLPYARRLEWGWSQQAPGGMVAMTVAELAALWNGMDI